jgi:RNA 3'-terminal phosphate cyclase
MRIQPEALARLRAAQMRGEAIATIFEHMGKMAEVAGYSAAEQLLTYQEPNAVVEEGDLVPIIILALRPANVGPTVGIPPDPAPE